jgi:hypothetical protein
MLWQGFGTNLACPRQVGSDGKAQLTLVRLTSIANGAEGPYAT